MTPGARRSFLLMLVAFGMLASSSCTGTPAEDTSPVVFGNGTIPATVPKDFPLPAGGVIGDTMIDRTHHRTEFDIQVGSDLVAVAQFFDIELVSSGYVVNRSTAVSDQMWQIDFSQGELSGQVTISSLGDSLSGVVVTMNVA